MRDNVELSLNKFIELTLENIENLSIHYFGRRRFVPPISDPWIRFDFGSLGISEEYLHYSGRDNTNKRQYAIHINGFIIAHINIHARIFDAEYRITDTLDIISKYFTDSRHVPILDYVGGGLGEIGTLHITDISDHTTDDGEQTGIITRIVFINTNILEVYTNER